MENDSLPGVKYWRLTLLSKGQGADNLYFQKLTQTTDNLKGETQAVNNVTINIINKTDAEAQLKEFTK